jgi:uncharacterized protein (DUF3084 family)
MSNTTDIVALKARCTKLEARATAVEGRCLKLETRMTAAESRCTKLEARIAALVATDAALAAEPLHQGDHAIRGYAFGLIDIQYAVHKSNQ